MTTTTETTENLDSLTTQIDAHDEDGKPTTIEIRIERFFEVFDVVATEDGEEIDGDSSETLEGAKELASEMAKQIKADDKTRERNRIHDQRTYRKESLLGTAEEFDGFDAQAVRMLARLIGKGQGFKALAVLKRVK